MSMRITRGLRGMVLSGLLILGLRSGDTVFAAPPEGYTLVWADEFDGPALNTNRWTYRTDSRYWSTQVPENVSVKAGFLHLAVKKQNANGKAYTGAGIISRARFRYGYYEARFRVPPGSGWHTSFWLMQHGKRGAAGTGGARQEIDICEQDSVDPAAYTVNLHNWEGVHKSYGFKRVKTPDLSAEFHVWGAEFTPTRVRYYFDGKPVQEIDATRHPHGDHNIWLTSIAAPLGGTKTVDETKLPAAAVFDYVRFYEKKPTQPATAVRSITP